MKRQPKLHISEKQASKQITVFSTPRIYHQVIPKVRMTRQGRFSPRAQRYLKSQEALAWEFKRYHKEIPIDYAVVLSFTVAYPDNRLRDIDNICKSIMDSLQYKGVVLENDCLIRGFWRCELLCIPNKTKAWLGVRLDKQIGGKS